MDETSKLDIRGCRLLSSSLLFPQARFGPAPQIRNFTLFRFTLSHKVLSITSKVVRSQQGASISARVVYTWPACPDPSGTCGVAVNLIHFGPVTKGSSMRRTTPVTG